MRKYGVFKIGNSYADSLGDRMYALCPKAVFAALAISLLIRLEGEGVLNDSALLLIQEWEILYQNGIIPQKPPKIQ